MTDIETMMDKLEKEILDSVKKEIKDTADYVRIKAVEVVAVDEGRLRASIVVNKIDDYNYEIGTNLSKDNEEKDGYAEYVEFGTSKMPPRPYLIPAHKKGLKRLIKNIKKVVDKAISKHIK